MKQQPRTTQRAFIFVVAIGLAACSTPTKIKELTDLTNEKLTKVETLLKHFATRTGGMRSLRISETRLIDDHNENRVAKLDSKVRTLKELKQKDYVSIYTTLKALDPVFRVGDDDDMSVAFSLVEDRDQFFAVREEVPVPSKEIGTVRNNLSELKKDPGFEETLDLMIKFLESIDPPKSK